MTLGWMLGAELERWKSAERPESPERAAAQRK